MKLSNLLFLSFITHSSGAFAQDMSNPMDELNPFEVTDQELQSMDESYERESGVSARLEEPRMTFKSDCYQRTCKVFIDVEKSTQHATIFVDGAYFADWKISSGTIGHRTPNFDKHPDGRVYDKYSSSKYPGGNWNGYGNMPFAVFIHRGFALHGTTSGNIPKLGTAASHGCIRMHPENARIFNRLVRAHGVRNTWVTVRN